MAFKACMEFPDVYKMREHLAGHLEVEQVKITGTMFPSPYSKNPVSTLEGPTRDTNLEKVVCYPVGIINILKRCLEGYLI